MGLSDSEDSLTIVRAVSTQYQRVTGRRMDRRTDRQTSSQELCYRKQIAGNLIILYNLYPTPFVVDTGLLNGFLFSFLINLLVWFVH